MASLNFIHSNFIQMPPKPEVVFLSQVLVNWSFGSKQGLVSIQIQHSGKGLFER